MVMIFTIPGPSSISSSKFLSGFGDKFLFYGFLPKTENELISLLKTYKSRVFSSLFYSQKYKNQFLYKTFKKYFFPKIEIF